MKNKYLYYILNLTWGLPLNIIGGLVALVLLVMGYKPRKWGGCFYFNVGERWGGIELGIFFITDKADSTHVKNHEFGHSIQNCIFGFVMPFLICIPSAIRYWYREIRERNGLKNKTAYDDIWFEGWATQLGTKYLKYFY